MALEIKIPKLGMSMKEATLIEWKLKEGDRVNEGDVVLVIQTEKVTWEVEAMGSGFLHIMVGPDAVRPVGAVVGLIAASKEELEKLQKESSQLPATEPEDAASGLEVQKSTAAAFAKNERVMASPVAKKMAKEHHIDLSTIIGTGPGGRICKEDIKKAIAEKDAGPTAGTSVSDDDAGMRDGKKVKKIVQLRGMRKTIADHMKQSLSIAAQLTTMIEVEATALKNMRAELVSHEADLGVRVTFNDIYVKAVAGALKEIPVINASLIDNEIVLWEDINIGVAVALQGADDFGGGLIVPVVKNADKKTLSEVSKELKDLIQKARNKKLMPDDVTGGTFTITNMGAVPGVEFKYGTPIINQPESAILSTGLIMDKPVVRDGEVVVRPMLPLSLTFDHRVIDGAPSSEFLGRLAKYLTEPFLLLS